MAMTPAQATNVPVSELNTTPLIDVMLVLLVMFILTIPVMTHAVKIDLPQRTSNPPTGEPPRVVDLEVDFDGTVVWNGAVVPGLADLESYLRTESRSDPQPEIHVRADGRARYGQVASVLAAVQRNHLRRIGFVNTAEFRD